MSNVYTVEEPAKSLPENGERAEVFLTKDEQSRESDGYNTEIQLEPINAEEKLDDQEGETEVLLLLCTAELCIIYSYVIFFIF